MADIVKQSIVVKAIVLTLSDIEPQCRGDYEVVTNEGVFNRSISVTLTKDQVTAVKGWADSLLNGITAVEMGVAPKTDAAVEIK